MHIQVEDTAVSIPGGEEKGEVKRMVELEVSEPALAIVSCGFLCMKNTLAWEIILKFNWTSANVKLCRVVTYGKTLDKSSCAAGKRFWRGKACRGWKTTATGCEEQAPCFLFIDNVVHHSYIEQLLQNAYHLVSS